MATADEAATPPVLAAREENRVLSDQWRALRRSATFVAILSAPAAFIWLWKSQNMAFGWAIVVTAVAVFAFRGLLDLIFRRFIPQPSLFALEGDQVREEDVLNRRRHWFWRFWYRIALFFVGFITIIFVAQWIFGGDVTWWGTATSIYDGIKSGLGNTALLSQLIILPFFFIFNFLILMGPMMMMGISQIKGFEPGDANWGVKLEDVRGQAEAKEEVRRIVSLWQSGKTMLAKAIATGFNCPFVSIPGSGFAQTFIGVDVLIVRYLARKAKRLAAKWGGQCIVFIDEIDAVAMRRSSLGAAMSASTADRYDDHCFYGQYGSQSSSGDLILETRGWRERMFDQRHSSRSPYPAWYMKLAGIVNQGAFPGMF